VKTQAAIQRRHKSKGKQWQWHRGKNNGSKECAIIATWTQICDARTWEREGGWLGRGAAPRGAAAAAKRAAAGHWGQALIAMTGAALR
jgi:hypothetical protein